MATHTTTHHTTTRTRTRTTTRTRLVLALVVLAVLATACGSAVGQPDAGDTGRREDVTTIGSGGGDPAPSGVTTTVADVADVDDAVVQIVAQGTFVDPEDGLVLNAAGSGSGFFIDQSGLVVTNNHVVTGAATLEVLVDGESHNARLVASSECSDLAVIDVEGEGFPALGWFEGATEVGLDVYAAGFPLGDPEFTLTRGIVSKARSGGETSWASVDAVLEHDANINPGNSGGPLVTGDGRVVGVNYAGRRDTAQFFAIAADEARPVIDSLVAGEPVDWIGINGQAVVTEDVSGVWVAAVESGSPASSAGLQAGDLITRMEGLVLATDGTLADYCDVLRTREGQAIAIEVLRPSTEEVLEGEINGRPLEQTFSFRQELGGTDMVSASPGAGASGYEYALVTDDTGLLAVEIPTAWGDIDGRPADDATLDLRAAPNLVDYAGFYDVPGMQFTVSVDPELSTLATDDILADVTTWRGACQGQGASAYDDGLFAGTWEAYSGCGGSDAGAIVVVARPPSGEYTIVLAVQVVSDADLEAADRILGSFFVDLP